MTTTTRKEIVCNEPYIRVGNDCCLDSNGNDICDRDEVPETTTTVKTTTTVLKTTLTTETTATTTTVRIACTVNSDCGQVEEKRICYRGDVYVQTLSPMCRRPGTPEAECIIKQSKLDYPAEKCAGQCKDGYCT